jgi:hypothetical protein
VQGVLSFPLHTMNILVRVFAVLSFALMAAADITSPTTGQNFVNGALIPVSAVLSAGATAANVTLSNGISYSLTIPALLSASSPATATATFIAPLSLTGTFVVNVVSDEGDNFNVSINILSNAAYCGYFPRRFGCCGVEGEEGEGNAECVSDFVEESAQSDPFIIPNIEASVACDV